MSLKAAVVTCVLSVALGANLRAGVTTDADDKTDCFPQGTGCIYCYEDVNCNCYGGDLGKSCEDLEADYGYDCSGCECASIPPTPAPVPHNCSSHYENPHPSTTFPDAANWDCCDGEYFQITYTPHAICTTSCSKASSKPRFNADASGGCPTDQPAGTNGTPYCFHPLYNDDVVSQFTPACAITCDDASDCANGDDCVEYDDDWGKVSLCVGMQYGYQRRK